MDCYHLLRVVVNVCLLLRMSFLAVGSSKFQKFRGISARIADRTSMPVAAKVRFSPALSISCLAAGVGFTLVMRNEMDLGLPYHGHAFTDVVH